VCLLLAAVTLVLYNPVNRHPFVNYDDDRYVTENRHIHQGLTVGTVSWALTSTEQANWHPLTWMSHALDYSLYRLNPAGHHFTSVLLHAANVILLFLLLQRLTSQFGPSLFVAAIFAVHPINVESVAWIAERKNVLCSTFFLLTLLAYGWYAKKSGWKRYLVVTVAFVAGLAAKPMVITLPFVLLLLDYWPLRRTSSLSWPKLIAEKLPFFALSAASAAITVHAQQAGGAMRSTVQFPLGVRVANAIHAYAMYLWRAIWPTRLAPVYPHPGSSLSASQVGVDAAVLLAITVLVIKMRGRRYLLVGWLWFLGTLVPVIGLVQVGDAAMADRYAYIPLIGVFLMVTFGVAEWVEAKRSAGEKNLVIVAKVCAVLILCVLAGLTHRQIGYWQSNVALWSHAVEVTPGNFIAEDNLGGALLLEGREEEAHLHFVAASRINPADPMSHSNLGAYDQTHHLADAAIREYQTAISLTSDPGLLAQTYANLGAAYRTAGDNVEALKDFQQALRLNSRQFNAWLGQGLIARSQGKPDEALADISRSLDLLPTAEGYLELGRTLEQMKRLPDALHAYEQALKLDPGYSEAQQAAEKLRQRQ
jgi:protein O-mannosyl-transferase